MSWKYNSLWLIVVLQSSYDIEVFYLHKNIILDATHQIPHWAPVSIYCSLRTVIVSYPRISGILTHAAWWHHLGSELWWLKKPRYLRVVGCACVIFSVYSVLHFWLGACCLYATSSVTFPLGCTSKIFVPWLLLPCFSFLLCTRNNYG